MLKIIEPGLLTTVQDSGRSGFQKYGICVAGVMDSFSAICGNLLVENSENEAVLEVTILGPRIEFLHDTIIAITGGDLSPLLNNSPIGMWESVIAKKGDELSFGGLRSGCRAYIAIAGGIDVPVVMGSRSTYLRGNLGGFNGRALAEGDELPVGKIAKDIKEIGLRKMPEEFIPIYRNKTQLHIIPGPQDDCFSEEDKEIFLNSEYEVTNQSDRMGYRLKGPVIKHKKGPDIISDGIPPGGIQIPGHGNPIIMLADRQTTGGYTKIATVISTDLGLVAQGKPGDIFQFKITTLEEAYNLLKNERDIFEKIKSARTEQIIPEEEQVYTVEVDDKTFKIGMDFDLYQ